MKKLLSGLAVFMFVLVIMAGSASAAGVAWFDCIINLIFKTMYKMKLWDEDKWNIHSSGYHSSSKYGNLTSDDKKEDKKYSFMGGSRNFKGFIQ